MFHEIVNGNGEPAVSEGHGLVPWMNDKPSENHPTHVVVNW